MSQIIVLSTGVIDNRAAVPGGARPVQSLVIRVENNQAVLQSAEGLPVVAIEVFFERQIGGGFGVQATYAVNQISLADVNQPMSTFTLDHVFADLDAFGVRCTVTSSGQLITSIPTVTVTGKSADGTIVRTYAVLPVT
ncbi:hypothetical protein [Cohnella rhizosphaerae]|uniref:Uncharacterized protein n=1 Tax=Cohnella rhizosphaerae TaxID=1457232 RepID=A0A9X4QUZ4_9BACL|nr:hypothetical protein [Cohnella rhizosphaerae]MDG0812230.1 hypothetical protein [Cohnella rhizosphaerae]